jgi:hypothetical protein
MARTRSAPGRHATVQGATTSLRPEEAGGCKQGSDRGTLPVVKQAQETRAALLQVLVSAATGLAGLVK